MKNTIAPHFNVGFQNDISIVKCRWHDSQSPVLFFNMALHSIYKKCRWGKPRTGILTKPNFSLSFIYSPAYEEYIQTSFSCSLI